MHWELWDTEIAGLVDTFETEEAALLGVRDLLAVNGPGYVEALALGAMFDEGKSRDQELPPVLTGANLQASVEVAARESRAEVTCAVHARIRQWLAEEGWRVEDVPIPAESFNIVALHGDGRAINIFQPEDVLDHVALSLRWSHGRVRQLIGEISDKKLSDMIWEIYRDASLMGIDVCDADELPLDMILRAHVYFDGLTKDVLMQRIQLVNRAYALAMRRVVRAQDESGRSIGHALSPDDVRRIMRPVAEAAGPLTVAS